MVVGAPYAGAAAKLLPVALSALATLFQLASFAVLALYVQDPSLSALPASGAVAGRSPVAVAVLVAGGFLLLFALAALFRFSAERSIIARAIAMERHAAGALKDQCPMDATLLARAPHYLGRITLTVYRATIPGIAAAAALVLMFVLKPLLTLAVLLLLVPFVPLYFIVARRGSRSVRDMMATARAHALERRSVAAPEPDEDGAPAGSASEEYLGAYRRRLTALFEGTLVSGLAIGSAIAVMGAWFVFDHASGTLAPGIAVFYALLARQFGSGLLSVGALTTQLGIFHPYVECAIPVLLRRTPG